MYFLRYSAAGCQGYDGWATLPTGSIQSPAGLSGEAMRGISAGLTGVVEV